MHSEYFLGVCKERRQTHPPRFMRRAWLLAGLVALAGLNGCDKIGGKSESDHMARAQAFYEDGQPRSGMIEIKNALQKNPDSPQARHLLAKIYLDLGQGAAAEQEITRAKKAAPQDMSLDLTLAEAWLTQRKYDQVLALDEKRLPGPAPAAQLRGEALLGLGRPDEACPLFDRAFAADPRFVPAVWGQAKCAAGRGDAVRAKALLDAALKLEPKNPRTWAYIADLERTEKRPQTALKAYDEALKLRPALLDALIGRAAIAVQINRLDVAEKDIKTLNSLNKDSLAGFLLQGMVDFRKQNYAQAKTSFDLVLKSSPDFMPAVLWAGFTSYALQNYGQASKHFYKYLQEFPQANEVRAIQALTQAKLGNPGAVSDLLKDVDPASLSDPQSLSMIGLAYLQLGNRDLGTRYLSEVVERNPKATASRLALAQALAAKNDVDGASRELAAAIAIAPKDPQPRILLVQILTVAKRYDAALRALEDLRGVVTEPAVVANLRGTIYAVQGKVGEARKQFEAALAEQPGYPPASHNLAQLEIRAKRPDLARQAYRNALQKFPNDVTLIQALVALERQANRFDEARTLLEAAHKRQPNDPTLAALLAREHLSRGDASAALAVTQQAAIAKPADRALLEIRGSAYLMRGDARSALNAYQRLANEAPDSAEAHYFVALGQTANGDYRAARGALKRSLELAPTELRSQAATARLDLQEKNFDAALAMANKIRQDHPQSAEGALIEAEVLMAQNRAGDAIAVLERAVREFPKAGGLAHRLAQALWHSGAKPRAIESARAQLARTPNDVELLLFVAEANEALGRAAEAQAGYEAVLRVQPQHARALNNLAWLLRSSDRARAMTLAEAAHRAAPADPHIADTLGWLLLQERKTARAEALLKQATEGAPNQLTYQYHYALALQQAGKTRSAERLLSEIVVKPFPEREEALAVLSKMRS